VSGAGRNSRVIIAVRVASARSALATLASAKRG